MKVDKNYFPGFVRKAITFTNDDGKLDMDKKFIEILKPYGIKGTFNLCDRKDGYSAEFYRDFYDGFGIANHCRLHPFALDDSVSYKILSEPFDKELADEEYIYTHESFKDMFHVAKAPKTWRLAATGERYVELIRDAQERIEEIFGKGVCVSFVWPFCEQNNSVVKEYVRNKFRSVRTVGATKDSEGFALPKDRYSWSYNATHENLLSVADIFDKYTDDGELKMFCFGLHSIDYEMAKKWDDLKTFAEKYGNRPQDFYYASVDEIFDYEDAVNSLIIKENSIENPSPLKIYVKVDGEPIVICANSVYIKA